jgi:dTDP-4-amino-4,6-dideoxygalactose transaminase
LTAERPHTVDCELAQYSRWFASGTGCLIAALEAIGVQDKWVAVPPNVCPNVIAAIFAAGAKPWFVDIEAKRQGMSPQALSQIISSVAAVIAVHAYGTPCLIDAITALCDDASVPLIEDCAQSQGATYLGIDVGNFGDFSVFSFGAGKILDAGGGGFVGMHEAHWDQRLHSISSSWPIGCPHDAGTYLSEAYKNTYNTHYPQPTTQSRVNFDIVMRKTAAKFRAILSSDKVSSLENLRHQTKRIVRERRQKYLAYSHLFAQEHRVAPVPLEEGAAPWRFNVLLDASFRNDTFSKLRAAGIKASTWYPDITRFLAPDSYRAGPLPVSREYDCRVLNLWVDEATTSADIERAAAMLVKLVR